MFIHMNFKCCNLPCLVTSDLTDFYKQVLNAFFASRSKTAEETSFQNEIPWGNNKFKVKNKHGYEVQYFTRWINADIIFVKDLKQLNNNICEQFIFEKVEYKNNIISEVMQMKHVLKPYKPIMSINELSNNGDKDNISPIINTTVKQFYINLIDLTFIPPSINKWIQLIGDISEKDKEKSFKVKIKMADKKLSEHNYKIITNILPCGYIVSKWDKSVSDNCVLCKEKHDLVHLLFTCVFAKEAW